MNQNRSKNNQTEVIELAYWWTNGKLLGGYSEWKKMYLSIKNFIALYEKKGIKDNVYLPDENHYRLEYSLGGKGRFVDIDEKSANLLVKSLGLQL